MSIAIENVSRRRFLEGMVSAGVFVLALRYVPEIGFAQTGDAANPFRQLLLHPSVYLGLEEDGTVHIIAHRSEMGTSSRTSLPMVLADELDADWARVRIQ